MKLFILFTLTVFAFFPAEVSAQLTERRVEQLETRVGKLEYEGKTYAGAAFVSGVLAALWAQNTKRNAWLWFFLAALFAPIALLVLLYKNSTDVRNR